MRIKQCNVCFQILFLLSTKNDNTAFVKQKCHISLKRNTLGVTIFKIYVRIYDKNWCNSLSMLNFNQRAKMLDKSVSQYQGVTMSLLSNSKVLKKGHISLYIWDIPTENKTEVTHGVSHTPLHWVIWFQPRTSRPGRSAYIKLTSTLVTF